MFSTRAATQADKHTFLGAQLDHTTRGINERTYSWNLKPVLGCIGNYPGCGANLLCGSKIPMDELTVSPAVVEAIEIKMTVYWVRFVC
ncbi:hypothetical protein KY290_004262 [Solanum tuberosum]|uniref:Uncharacterized protein n=1 Tax=Solanum tuberosum TaxID=4113 RepID=A0ABQ7WXE8_SOLTU|nr:hypothetical protein KY290_004262 [Solanum tuberosum]